MAAVQNAHRDAEIRPAEPLLASSLVDLASLNAGLNRLLGSGFDGPVTASGVLQVGVSSLDDALGNTLQSGRVVAISSEANSQRDDLAKMLLVDCLVRHAESLVAVIDATGNFDVVDLYTRILSRLEREPERVVELGGGKGDESEKQKRESVAAGVLDRVKIMRVFDFVGVREAVGELRDGLEGRVKETENVKQVVTPRESVREKDESQPQRRTEIADSEDEDEDLEASDDEMLFDTEAPPAEPQPAQEPAPSPAIQANQHDASESQPLPKLKLILIDNLAHVLTPLLKKDTIPGNLLAATFLTTLSNLTRTHALYTILLNPCSAPRTPSPARQLAAHSTQQPQTAPTTQQSYVPQPPPPPSIFSSNAAIPMLLGLLGWYTDAHLLLARMPRRKMDARVYYADTGVRERGKRRGVEMVGVLEIVADRWGGRVGAWAAFAEGREGRGVQSV